ncbi:hypothetical protein [Thermoproteus tenax]|uniref:Uncharacterized conserved protein n=1 Tax=Thermoproteus tenax (strain ATCC 35583 / DSM 2078 / JCM 9277 / NBRC 100435 / Kra 1) TaxID=768679 RepID=G4RMG2_THETK|nr:hypothetical protein [Thermoproteus tenax]CCC80793.1 Uncharacterized conserved protein [Thermoproteus tenax Kra 1]
MDAQEAPLLEVVMFVPTRAGICRTCDSVAKAFKIELTEDLGQKSDSDFEAILVALSRLNGSFRVRFTNPLTLRGLYLMAKYRTGKVPLIIFNRRLVHKGPVKNPEYLVKKLKMFMN